MEVKNITDEIPFDIPDSWCWVRLSSLSSISAGGTPERGNPNYWTNGTIPWLKISDITSSKKFVNSCTEYITDEGMQNSSAKILPKGTILYTIFATIGEVGILGINASCNQAIAGIQTYLRSIDGYLYYYLVNLQDFMRSISKGCAQFNINQKILKEAFVPLPPLAEQKRIVAEIEKFEPLIAEYDKYEQQATKLDGEIYDKLKKSILQYAIQGKLVPQDSNDEPAAVLLERIRAEKKAQLGKKYVDSYIYKGDDNCYYEHINGKDVDITEEVPYELPMGWEWTRVSNIADVRDGTHNTPKYVSHGYPLVTSKNLINGKIDFLTAKLISKDDLIEINKRSNVDNGDILFAMIGSIGNPVKVLKDREFAIKNMALFKPILPKMGMDYIYLFLIFIQDFMRKQAAGGVQQFVSLNFLRNYLFPLPPLAEQKRIVEKIDEIFAKL